MKKNKIHPMIPELQSKLQKNEISRRQFLKTAGLLGVTGTTAYSLAGIAGATALTSLTSGCGGAQPTKKYFVGV